MVCLPCGVSSNTVFSVADGSPSAKGSDQVPAGKKKRLPSREIDAAAGTECWILFGDNFFPGNGGLAAKLFLHRTRKKCIRKRTFFQALFCRMLLREYKRVYIKKESGNRQFTVFPDPFTAYTEYTGIQLPASSREITRIKEKVLKRCFLHRNPAPSFLF